VPAIGLRILFIGLSSDGMDGVPPFYCR
jgi:hypothetical protein